MFTCKLIDPWATWVAALARRLPTIVLGILLAAGRRTVTRWWIAAGITHRFRSYSYCLDSISRKTQPVAAALLRIVLDQIPSGDRLIFAIGGWSAPEEQVQA